MTIDRARALFIGFAVACVALPGLAGCGQQQAPKPIAVHPTPKPPPPPPEMLDSDRHRGEAIAAVSAYAGKKYSGKLDLEHPRAEFLGGHAMAVPGANPGKLVMKDAPVGTWRIYLKVLKATTISTAKADTGAMPDEEGSAGIGTRGFLARPDLSVVETQGLPSFAPGSGTLEQGGQAGTP